MKSLAVGFAAGISRRLGGDHLLVEVDGVEVRGARQGHQVRNDPGLGVGPELFNLGVGFVPLCKALRSGTPWPATVMSRRQFEDGENRV